MGTIFYVKFVDNRFEKCLRGFNIWNEKEIWDNLNFLNWLCRNFKNDARNFKCFLIVCYFSAIIIILILWNQSFLEY